MTQQHICISLKILAQLVLYVILFFSRLFYYFNTATTLETTTRIYSVRTQNAVEKAIFPLPSQDPTAYKHVLRTSDHYRPRCTYRLYLWSGLSTWFLSLYRLVLFAFEIITAWGLHAKCWQDNLLSRLSCVHEPHHPSNTTPPEQLPWPPALYCHFGWRVEKCSATGSLSDCTTKNVLMPSPGRNEMVMKSRPCTICIPTLTPALTCTHICAHTA